MKIGMAVLRLVVGLLFVGHGMQKLAGWFGGGGVAGTAAGFESMGIKPGRDNAVAAGVSEAGGGALLAAGLATPLAATMISGAMGSAVYHVHRTNGPWVTQGGWEYNAVLTAVVFAVAAAGPGELSLDHALGIERSGPAIALAAIGAGLLGSAGVAARARSLA
ncbi:DoxX family protein [Actinomycetospora chiangmaiensis]|uniref:DoxX family protein n=1 Tax=Actinomycetospora chiangmaiensis TaxID=402650 RepID=UPI000367FC07|nr:DoxX family protein [Actinomycetospora chiangmaiensis]